MPTGWTETSLDDGDVLVRFYVNGVYSGGSGGSDVVQATCVNGEVTVPTMTPRRSPGSSPMSSIRPDRMTRGPTITR